MRHLQRGFLLDNSMWSELPSLDNKRSYAWDINEAGQIAGFSSSPSGKTHGVLWENGQVIDLGMVGTEDNAQAEGINDQGQIVGTISRTFGGDTAFIWEDGAMCELDDLAIGVEGWHFQTAYDINNHGQITGAAISPTDGLMHGYLLTPVPEPATLSLLAAGGLALLRRKRR